jgi:hypothetical protein
LTADGGVSERTRTDLARDHLARVQPDPYLEIDVVLGLHFDGKRRHLLLDCQCGTTGTNSMVLQGCGRAEYRHDPVAGKAADRPPETLHRRGTPVRQFGHDLA